MYSAVYTVPGLLFITISRPTEPLQLPRVPLLAMLEQEVVEVVEVPCSPLRQTGDYQIVK